MQALNIALLQADLAWEDARTNLRRFDQKFDQVPDGTHLVVLPEMFSTGFSMHTKRLGQAMDGAAVNWMKEKAKESRADVAGSLIIGENGRFYNRLVWAKPDGTVAQYDKKHLFRYGGENSVFTAGEKQVVVVCHGWRIRPFICYDLRFPIWTRNLNNVYDVALFVANWPEQRADQWRALLVARAIENQSYVLAVNRVGVDGNGNRYRGDSCVVEPSGRRVAEVHHDEAVVVEALSHEHLTDHRERFPAWMDADGDLLR